MHRQTDGQTDQSSIKTVKCKAQKAFTLAEVLITLTIIGVVAALTIPALIENSQEREYKTAKDKVRMSIAEAGRILSVRGDIASASSAKDFVENYLSKQLKIIKFCDPSTPAGMEQCGMPSGTITTLKKEDGSSLASMPATWKTITEPYGVTSGTDYDNSSNNTVQNFNNGYTFLSADGIAVNLFYNPYCVATSSERSYTSTTYSYTNTVPQMSLDTACMSGVYDMNGLKKPNQVGKDIGFFGVFYNGLQSTAVATLPYKEGIDTYSANWAAADSYCRGLKGQKLPTVDEASALYLGSKITTIPTVWLWSASWLPGSSSYVRVVDFSTGFRGWDPRSVQFAVRCVRD